MRQILLVDDDVGFRTICLSVLTTLGYSVDSAASLGEALGCLQREQYKLVLTDYALTGDDHDTGGLVIAKLVKKRSPQTTVALMSGADLGELKSYRQQGVDIIFVKPFDFASLNEFIGRHVN